MPRSVPRLALVLPILIAASPRQTSDPPGALPYDLAFGMKSFIWSTELSPSPDGRRVAYDVRQPPAEKVEERYESNGTPSAMVGSKIYFTDYSSKPTVEVCPARACWRPVWSPDSKSLAFFSDAGGSPQLWVYDLATGSSRRVLDKPVKAKLWSGDEVKWSPDGATIYVGLAPEGPYRLGTRPQAVRVRNAAGVIVLRSGTEASAAPAEDNDANPNVDHYSREHLVDVAAVDVKSGTSRIVLPATATPPAGVIRISASGKWLGYLSVLKQENPNTQGITLDVGVISTAGGKPTVLAQDVPLPQPGHNYRLNYSWHPTEDRLVYFKDKRLWFVDFSSGVPPSPKQLAPQLGDVAPTVLGFTRDGKSVVMGIDPFDDKGYGDLRPRGIAVVPLDGSAPAPFSIDDATWTFREILKADERTVWQPDGSSINLLLTDRSTGERAVVRFAPRTGQSKVLWKGMSLVGNLTAGGHHDFIVGTYEDLQTPPNVYRFNPDFSSKDRVSHIDPRLDGVAVGRAEVFETTIPLYNGTLTKVRTAVLLPPGAKRGDRLPALVTMYPGSDVMREAGTFGGGDVVTVPNLVFTSRGYAVILCDLTIGPNREAGNPIQEMVDVLLPQVYRAVELGYVDINRLAIMGQSFGGYGTASIITRTNLFRAAVPISGIYDLPGTYGKIDAEGGSGWIGWLEAGQARMGTHPWANLRRYLENSPYYQADKIFTPVLIIHGTSDGAYHESGKLFAALRRLGRPAQLASYQDQGHVISDWKRVSAMDAAQRMVEFYRRHLRDPGQRSAQTH